MPDEKKKPTQAEIKRTADVNLVALKMKKYHDGDMHKVQHFVRVYTHSLRASASSRNSPTRSSTL